MAHSLRKLLLAAAGGLLTSLLIGSISATAAETDLDAIMLNRFIITSSGNRVLTGSVASDSVTQAGWYVSENDILYYYYSDGTCAQDQTTLDDGSVYMFASDGALKTGWQTVDSKRYYYDAELGRPVYGWFTYLDQLYYIDQNNGKLTGTQEINGTPYSFDEYGCVQTGLISYEDGSLYFYDNTATPASGWATMDAGTYYFTENGAAMGVTAISGLNYYFSDAGLLQTGWITSGNDTLWANTDGSLATGAATINGKQYYFNENGIMQYGFVQTGSGSLYCGKDGTVQTGIQAIDGSIYYFDTTTGIMQTGWQTVGAGKYYFDPTSGALQTGWMNTDDGKLYLTDKGVSSGLTTIDGSVYYFNPTTGVMQTGWVTVGSTKYCFDTTTGALKTGWILTDSGTIYMTKQGMATGLTQIDGNVYYFLPSNGIMQTGWVTTDGVSRYFDPATGIMTQTGNAPVQLNVVDYKQFGESWSDTKITYSTIGKVGCLVTSIAMKYSYQTGTSTTPDKILSKLSFSGDSLLWSSCTDLGYTVETVSGSMSQSMMQTIYTQLQNNKPVIVGAKTSSGGQHYIVVTGYTGSTGSGFSTAKFIINDPGSSKRTLLSEYLAVYPVMYKLIY